ncbi:hypothetical protein V495_04833 [Pseudogymnoascus sp. VKM F-4514 (FW-929)]|nr:hypothetical protein V495_04833 [Pseudogymnoascus sp. VKM F-4514 (FW-929)]KFY61724.1 hypothetical protein V497_02755 [Pseudogymnoascus sp. VKM F-4516 (FW-969)]
MGYITNVSKSAILLVLTSFIWVDSGLAQSEYPNPFAAVPPAPPAPAGPAGGSAQAEYPNPFAPVPSGPPATGSAAGGTEAYPNPFAPVTSGCSTLADTNVAVCPTSDNSVYYTSDGTFFKIQCNHHLWTTTIQTTTAPTFQECIDKCSQENTCNSVNYDAPNGRGCSLLSSTGAAIASDIACPNHHYAYKIDPPTQPAKDEMLVACSTSCPSANGLRYSSMFGETFRINCGKRHGTEYLKTDKQATLKDCMDSCASYIPCHSVDYHDRSRTCYYSNHHGEPTIVTPGFSSAYSLGCASSCCGSAASSSKQCNSCNSCSEACVAPKPLGPPMPDLSCGNQGLQYAFYSNTKPDGSTNLFTGTGYPTFDPAKFKTDPLQYSGTTPSIGFSSATPIYGNAPTDPNYTVINHRAYIFAQQSGTYTFRLPLVDDISILWVGPAAYSGFTRANANIVQSFVSGAQTPVTYTVTFEEGKYYPMRVIWANGGGAGVMSFELKGPDGKVIIDASTTEPSPFLVQYSCDETTAPRFAPFGNPSTLRHLHQKAIWRAPLDYATATGLRRFTVETTKLGRVEESVIPDPHPSVSRPLYGAIVVGAGPAGLATVGTLLDEDVKPILWVDEKFQGGRLNARYREVPSNTKVSLFIAFARATAAFRKIADQDPTPPAYAALQAMDQDTGCDLAAAGDMCVELTAGLGKEADVVMQYGHVDAGSVNEEGVWSVATRPSRGTEAKEHAIATTRLLVLATGARPLPPRLPDTYGHLSPLHLDTALSPTLLAKALPKNEDVKIALIGASHSAILVLRNLYELARSTHPGLRVKWFSRHPLRYAVDKGDWILRDNTGLKGETAVWARQNLEEGVWEGSDVKGYVQKIFTTPGEEEKAAYERELGSKDVDMICEAIGFEKSDLPRLARSSPRASLDEKAGVDSIGRIEADGLTGSLRDDSGEIKGLKGVGIAWPERVTDKEGNVESAVGLWKFMSSAPFAFDIASPLPLNSFVCSFTKGLFDPKMLVKSLLVLGGLATLGSSFILPRGLSNGVYQVYYNEVGEEVFELVPADLEPTSPTLEQTKRDDEIVSR